MRASPKNLIYIILPALLTTIEVAPLLRFQLPSIHDTLTESYEPQKTIAFFASHGAAVHDWGPLPSLFFGPAYAAVLSDFRWTSLRSLSEKVRLLDFDDATVISPLIFAGRLTVLIVMTVAMTLLTWTLARNLDDARVGLVVVACLSTSLIAVEPAADTKPDGLMNALLMISLASYSTIIIRGLTMARAMVTALFYVASLSCKELTSTCMFLPFAGIAGKAFIDSRRDPAEGKRKLRILAAAFLAVGAFYVFFNVIYAPHSWAARMHDVFGPLKDPAIWASPNQTLASYLRNSVKSVGEALGPAGLAVLAIAVTGTVLRPSVRLAGLWLPFISHLIFTVLLAGYMPGFFMLPLAPMLCLPASEVLARWLKTRTVGPATEAWTLGLVAAPCLYLGLNAMAVFRATHHDTLVERSLREAVPKGSTVNVMNPWRITSRAGPIPGPNETEIDPSPVSVLARQPRNQLPEYVLVDTALEGFLNETRLLPARAAMLENSAGYDFRKFPGWESLGYGLIATAVPEYPNWVVPGLVVNHRSFRQHSLKIYRLRHGMMSNAF